MATVAIVKNPTDPEAFEIRTNFEAGPGGWNAPPGAELPAGPYYLRGDEPNADILSGVFVGKVGAAVPGVDGAAGVGFTFTAGKGGAVVPGFEKLAGAGGSLTFTTGDAGAVDQDWPTPAPAAGVFKIVLGSGGDAGAPGEFTISGAGVSVDRPTIRVTANEIQFGGRGKFGSAAPTLTTPRGPDGAELNPAGALGAAGLPLLWVLGDGGVTNLVGDVYPGGAGGTFSIVAGSGGDNAEDGKGGLGGSVFFEAGGGGAGPAGPGSPGVIAFTAADGVTRFLLGDGFVTVDADSVGFSADVAVGGTVTAGAFVGDVSGCTGFPAGGGAVDSVNGKAGVVVLTAADVGAAGLAVANLFPLGGHEINAVAAGTPALTLRAAAGAASQDLLKLIQSNGTLIANIGMFNNTDLMINAGGSLIRVYPDSSGVDICDVMVKRDSNRRLRMSDKTMQFSWENGQNAGIGYTAGGIRITDGSDAGGGYLVMPQRAAPATVTDAALLYAKDVSGTAELFVRDEAGTETQISPHAMDGPPSLYDAADPLPHVVREHNEFIGGVRYCNLSRTAYLLEELLRAIRAGKSLPQIAAVLTARPASAIDLYHAEAFAAHNARLGLAGDRALVRRVWADEQDRLQAGYDAARAVEVVRLAEWTAGRDEWDAARAAELAAVGEWELADPDIRGPVPGVRPELALAAPDVRPAADVRKPKPAFIAARGG